MQCWSLKISLSPAPTLATIYLQGPCYEKMEPFVFKQQLIIIIIFYFLVEAQSSMN